MGSRDIAACCRITIMRVWGIAGLVGFADRCSSRVHGCGCAFDAYRREHMAAERLPWLALPWLHLLYIASDWTIRVGGLAVWFQHRGFALM